MESCHPLVKLAKDTIRSYVTKGVTPKPPGEIAKKYSDRRGVFVCIKKHGQLRGCIGTIEPTRNNLAEEVIHNSISSSSKDPRFPSVSTDELDDLAISVDILTTPEKVTDKTELDPKKYGITVSSKFKRGVLLPDLEGVDTVENQLKIAKSKGGIGPDEEFEIHRFEVNRFTDK